MQAYLDLLEQVLERGVAKEIAAVGPLAVAAAKRVMLAGADVGLNAGGGIVDAVEYQTLEHYVADRWQSQVAVCGVEEASQS